MEFLTFVIFLLITFSFLQTFLLMSHNLKLFSGNLPPGPFPFPVIGNLLNLGKNPHQSLTKIAKTYGPIISLRLGQKTTVVISSADLAKQVLQTHDLTFSSRAIPDAVRAANHHDLSILYLPVSHRWRTLRKISNAHIFSSVKLDNTKNLRHQKVCELIREVEKSCTTCSVIDIGELTFKSTLNLMSNTIFSTDLAHGNFGREFKELVWKILEDAVKPNLVDYFPFLKFLDPQGFRRKFMNYFDKMIEIFDPLIDQRLKLREKENLPIDNHDMLDYLLMGDQENGEVIDRTFIPHFLLDLFIAGTHTSSSAIEWAMAELMKNPETLSKAKAELRKVIGKGNPVRESDIFRLPYLRAIVKETLRLHPLGPLLVPRRSESEVKISGFKIPKNAEILVNVWAIGRDSNKWENPNSFMPERFLGSEMDFRGRDFDLIPFGSGRRMCPGVSLADRMLHMILGSLIHLFDWKLEDGVSPENLKLEEEFGLALKLARGLRVVPVLV